MVKLLSLEFYLIQRSRCFLRWHHSHDSRVKFQIISNVPCNSWYAAILSLDKTEPLLTLKQTLDLFLNFINIVSNKINSNLKGSATVRLITSIVCVAYPVSEILICRSTYWKKVNIKVT